MELLLWLNTCKRNKAGRYPLQLRITVEGRRAIFTTEHSLDPSEWNQTRQKLRGDSKAVRLNNENLKTLLASARVNKDMLQAEANAGGPPLNARAVADSLRPTPEVGPLLVGEALEAARQKYYATGNAATFDNYAAGLSAWRRWRAGADLQLATLAVADAVAFANWLRPQTAPTTRSIYVQQLHSLYAKARPGFPNPFAKLADTNVGQLVEPRRPLTAEQMRTLQELSLAPDSPQGRARAVFLTSYYLHGVRLLNVLTLRWCDIFAGRVELRAVKRGKVKDMALPAPLAAVLAHYPATAARPATAPLLPLLPADYFQQPPAEQLRLKKAATAAVDGALNRLAKALGLSRLHAHAARHTLAKAAKDATGDVWMVKELLGHRSIEQTEAYLESLSTDAADAAGLKIYGI